MSENSVTVELVQNNDYRFDIHFGDTLPVLTGDEPVPLGTGLGPSPVQLLCAAVGNCLSNSLLFALRKFKQAPEPLRCTVQAEVGRNTDNRLRVLRMTATLRLGVPAAQLQHLDRVLAQFEAYCTVTQSIRQSIPVALQMFDSSGMQLRQTPPPFRRRHENRPRSGCRRQNPRAGNFHS